MKDIVKWLSVTPAVDDTTPYAAGDLIGDVLEIDLAGFRDTPGLVLQSVLLVDEAGEEEDIDLVLFDSDPDATTFTDNAALDLDPADLARIVGVVPLTAYFAFDSNAIAQAANLALPIRLDWRDSGPASIFVALVARGTPGYGAATDLTLKLGFAAL